MATTSAAATIPMPATPAPGRAPSRLVFADHLWVALIVLVVLHYLAVVYAANTGFYYLEPPSRQPLALVALVVFQLLNQAFFMGLFFLLSGYFSPGSFDRKGAAAFLGGGHWPSAIYAFWDAIFSVGMVRRLPLAARVL